MCEGSEPLQAEDAIPKDAIWLTDAYECLVALLLDQPQRQPRFNEYWSEVLEKSRQREQKVGHDPAVFDKDLEEEWHRRKEANLLLRLEIEAKRLTACVRDPKTGEVLQLKSDGWIPDTWEDYVPPGIWDDYIIQGNYEAPGPRGTLIHGELRSVFFKQDEFEEWINQQFETGSKAAFADVVSKPPSRLRDAVKEAARALWGDEIPAGVRAKTRDSKINAWLKENGRATASPQTIRRALEKSVERK
jgi:hypothetical protein